MAEGDNVWTHEIEDDELGELLNRAATSGHPEWAYHVRYGLSKETMSESEAKSYLEECFTKKEDKKEGADADEAEQASGDEAPKPARKAASKS